MTTKCYLFGYAIQEPFRLNDVLLHSLLANPHAVDSDGITMGQHSVEYSGMRHILRLSQLGDAQVRGDEHRFSALAPAVDDAENLLHGEAGIVLHAEIVDHQQSVTVQPIQIGQNRSRNR